MKHISGGNGFAVAPTRRQMIARSAIALGSLGTGLKLQVSDEQQSMAQAASTTESKTRTSLHQEVALMAPPPRIYEILLDSRQFAVFTGLSAEIEPKPGGAFVMFGGLIEGRNIELVLSERIVQAWRPTAWAPGTYSLVRFQLKPDRSNCTVTLDHSSFPEGLYDHLSSGWAERYWEPLKKYLART